MRLCPQYTQVDFESNITTTLGTTLGDLVTGSATPHAKGSWAELIASTAHDSYGFWLLINATRQSGADSSQLLDIGVGAAGGEVILQPDILAGFKVNARTALSPIFIPIFIPKGTRISARNQGVIASDTVRVAIELKAGLSLSIPIFYNCDTIGVVSGSSTGTDVVMATDAFGSWTEIPASTTTPREYGAILLLCHGENDTGWTARLMLFDVGYSAVSLNYITAFNTNTDESIIGPFPTVPFQAKIPSGTQLQVRGAIDSLTPTERVALYGFY